MKRVIVFVVLLSLAISVVGDDVTYKAGLDYEIALPSDWVEIPKEILEQYQNAVSETTGQAQTYEYGYQLYQSENWLVYPYALVQVRRTGRVPEGQLKDYKKIESGFEEGRKRIEGSAGSVFANSSQGETIYEPEIHTLWSNISMDVEGVGRAKVLIAIKLTEYGYIQFMGYALEKEFSQFEPLYHRIVKSIKLDKKDVYTPRLTDNAPTVFGINLGQTAIAAIVGGLLAGVFGWFLKVGRKNS